MNTNSTFQTHARKAINLQPDTEVRWLPEDQIRQPVASGRNARRPLLQILALMAATLVPGSQAQAQGTAFSYQGALNDNGGVANGVYDLEFRVFDQALAGNQQGSTVAISDLSITNGLFTVTLDPGVNVFTGGSRWLQIAVRPGDSVGAYTAVSPRQNLTPAPYAIYAGKASMLDGPLPSGQLSGTYSNAVALNNISNQFIGRFIGDGGALTNLNATNLIGTVPSGALANAWKATGNAATVAGTNFLGTTDDEPLEIKVNGQRAFRFEPNAELAPNVIGGASVNYVGPSTVGATIGGGGTLNYLGLGAVESNTVVCDFGTISGGWSNVVRSTGVSATIGGGYGNVASKPDATVGGGFGNDAGGSRSTIAGGQNNRAGGDWSAVGGGGSNTGGNSYAAIAGGSHNGVFGQYSAIGGGQDNVVDGQHSVVSGGGDNAVALNYANVCGGFENTNVGNYSSIGGGRHNTVETLADYSGVLGGRDNTVDADYALAGGRRAKSNHNGAFVWADSTDADFASVADNEFALRASGGARVIGSPTLGSLTVAPNEPINGDDSQLLLAEDHDGTYGMLLSYDGAANRFQVFGKTDTGLTTAHLSIARDSGNVGIGRIATANPLEVEGDASKTVAGNWLANSDARIKQDIAPVTGALEKIGAVRLVSFHYTEDYRKAHPVVEDRRYLNVVAQEFKEVFPEHVKASGEKLPDGSEILQVDIHPLTIYSAAAIQELNKKLEESMATLRADLVRLDAQNAELRQIIARIQASRPGAEGGLRVTER